MPASNGNILFIKVNKILINRVLGSPGWALVGPWALGPLGLGDPWALGTLGPWGPWALGTLGLGDPWALGARILYRYSPRNKSPLKVHLRGGYLGSTFKDGSVKI